MSTTPKELLISHLFDAPQEAVFQAWTDPEQLKHWYAPDGCTIEYKSIDVKPGGHFHSCIHDPEHGDCWITGTYVEVSPPDKLVLTMALSNEHGQATNALEAGKPEDWPAEILTTVTFRTIAGQTQVTIHQTVAEAEAKKTGAYQSWIKMFHKLNQLLTQ
ncbi:SRPBCC family protein [Mucilaginibacter sp. HD30]